MAMETVRWIRTRHRQNLRSPCLGTTAAVTGALAAVCAVRSGQGAPVAVGVLTMVQVLVPVVTSQGLSRLVLVAQEAPY